MKKLLVVNTYKEKLELHKQLNKQGTEISIASLEDGAGRADVPPGEKIDLVVLPKCNEIEKLVEYASRLERFITDLRQYNLIHSNTIMQ